MGSTHQASSVSQRGGFCDLDAAETLGIDFTEDGAYWEGLRMHLEAMQPHELRKFALIECSKAKVASRRTEELELAYAALVSKFKEEARKVQSHFLHKLEEERRSRDVWEQKAKAEMEMRRETESENARYRQLIEQSYTCVEASRKARQECEARMNTYTGRFEILEDEIECLKALCQQMQQDMERVQWNLVKSEERLASYESLLRLTPEGKALVTLGLILHESHAEGAGVFSSCEATKEIGTAEAAKERSPSLVTERSENPSPMLTRPDRPPLVIERSERPSVVTVQKHSAPAQSDGCSVQPPVSTGKLRLRSDACTLRERKRQPLARKVAASEAPTREEVEEAFAPKKLKRSFSALSKSIENLRRGQTRWEQGTKVSCSGSQFNAEWPRTVSSAPLAQIKLREATVCSTVKKAKVERSWKWHKWRQRQKQEVGDTFSKTYESQKPASFLPFTVTAESDVYAEEITPVDPPVLSATVGYEQPLSKYTALTSSAHTRSLHDCTSAIEACEGFRKLRMCLSKLALDSAQPGDLRSSSSAWQLRLLAKRSRLSLCPSVQNLQIHPAPSSPVTFSAFLSREARLTRSDWLSSCDSVCSRDSVSALSEASTATSRKAALLDLPVARKLRRLSVKK